MTAQSWFGEDRPEIQTRAYTRRQRWDLYKEQPVSARKNPNHFRYVERKQGRRRIHRSGQTSIEREVLEVASLFDALSARALPETERAPLMARLRELEHAVSIALGKLDTNNQQGDQSE